MIVLTGKSVYKDVCIGKMTFYHRDKGVIKRYRITDAQEEINRFDNAKKAAIDKLDMLYKKMCQSMGEADAAIFEIHKMMLEDEDYCDSVKNIIKVQMVNAEYAVGTTADNFSEMFLAMDDDYMRGRAADVKDISERLLSILAGNADNNSCEISDEDVIIASDDLAPSETVQLDKSRVKGFVLSGGSINSHTAILARSMGIPAVIGVGEELNNSLDGKYTIVDGFTGNVYIDPDEATISKMKAKQEESRSYKELLKSLKGKENITKDGTRIKIYANIGNLSDMVQALDNDAEGVGLFRSEFIFLESSDFPTEEQQFRIYKQAAENMAGKKVIIRTLDIGADKKCEYFKLAVEDNPALGYRAIRICIRQPEIFKVQLRALYRAAAFGNISIMYPMITSVEEMQEIKRIEAEVRNELKEEGIPFRENIETGIMIETPAAAIISDELAEMVDFFSIGTNDLTQYTLALDRQNRMLDSFYKPHHEAIMRLIKMSVDNAHKAGIWCGICGELGADTELTERFLRMGIDELSVSSSMVLRIRDRVRNIDLSN